MNARSPEYRALQLCSNGGGVEAVPLRPVRLDLARVRHALEGRGVTVVDARVILIVGTDPELTVSRTGRVLVKTRDFGRAQTVIDQFFEWTAVGGSTGGARATG